MLYCSLNADVRQENMAFFFSTYYASFASMCALAKKTMPFPLTQLRREFYEKNHYGLMISLYMIPIIFVNPDDSSVLRDFTSDGMAGTMKLFLEAAMSLILKNPNLKPRLLNMFEEMRQNGLFDGY